MRGNESFLPPDTKAFLYGSRYSDWKKYPYDRSIWINTVSISCSRDEVMHHLPREDGTAQHSRAFLYAGMEELLPASLVPCIYGGASPPCRCRPSVLMKKLFPYICLMRIFAVCKKLYLYIRKIRLRFLQLFLLESAEIMFIYLNIQNKTQRNIFDFCKFTILLQNYHALRSILFKTALLHKCLQLRTLYV